MRGVHRHVVPAGDLDARGMVALVPIVITVIRRLVLVVVVIERRWASPVTTRKTERQLPRWWRQGESSICERCRAPLAKCNLVCRILQRTPASGNPLVLVEGELDETSAHWSICTAVGLILLGITWQ